jgi:hypothetical protein
MGKEGGGIWKRAGYSVSRVVVTRTDSGKPTFNTSEIVGSAAAVSVSNFYYPHKEQTVSNWFRNWGLDITYDSVTFVFHEFWPDISHAIFSKAARRSRALVFLKGAIRNPCRSFHAKRRLLVDGYGQRLSDPSKR